MLNFVYNFLTLLLTPFALWKLRGISEHTAGRATERLGFTDPNLLPNSIVVHGSSVGEIIAATPVIRSLQNQSDTLFTVTCMTPTGSEQIRETFGDSVQHCFLPLDRKAAMIRFLNHMTPKAIVIIETELWPNLLKLCAERRIPVFIINARISDKSVANYIKFKSIFAPGLAALAKVFAQSEVDQQRFIKLGVPASKVDHTGNIKFDISLNDETREQQRSFKSMVSHKSPIFIAASTHQGEDAPALNALKKSLQHYDNALLIIVPRHPERFDDVADMAELGNLKLQRRSTLVDGDQVDEDTKVLLIDAMGELLPWYGCANVAFIGGSLVNVGGHNPIEAALFNVPIVAGPNRQNFREIYQWLQDAEGVQSCHDADSLAQVWIDLAESPELSLMQAQNAMTVIHAQQGAMQRTVDSISTHLNQN